MLINDALVVMLATCIFTDITRRVIPNFICVGIALLGVLEAGMTDLSTVYQPILCSALIFIGGLALHQKKVLGGGDIKLGAALVTWLTPLEISRFVWATMAAGGVVGLFYMGMGFIRRLRDKSAPAVSSVPYALAIVTGFFFLRPERFVSVLRP